MKTNSKKLPKSQLEVEFELDEQEFQKYVDDALLHLRSHVKMDGFRPGQVPKDIVEKRVGDENLLMEAGDLAIKGSYAKYVNESDLELIGNPEVSIKKIAKGSPFLFTVKVSVLPELELPDYQKIISQIKMQEISVDEKEIENALNYLQKSRAKFTTENRSAQNKDFVEIEYQNKDVNNGKVVKDRFVLGEGGFVKDFENNLIGMRSGQEKEFTVKFPENNPRKDLAGKDVNFKAKMVSVQKMELHEINDEFAKSLGGFDSLIALKENLKEGIILEKKEGEKQRQRNRFLEKITEKIEFQIPEKLVEAESARLLEDLKNNISSKFKITFEEYLASVKQTEEELKKTFAKEAEKRIKNFLVLKEIGKKENIEVSEKEIKEELDKTIRNYSKGELVKIDMEKLKEYTRGAVYNEKVFQLLEKLSQK